MKTRCWLFLALTLVAALTIAGRPSAQVQTPIPPQRPAPTAAPSGNAENGKKLFTGYGCYECHGREAQGSTATGPRLGPRPLAFTALSKYVRQPTGQMPPYTSKVVSDADLADIYAFLQAQPQPPALESIQLLK